MDGKKRYIGLVIFLVAAISAMVWAYGFVTNRQQGPNGVSIGVVRIDDVLEFIHLMRIISKLKMS